MSIKIHRCLCFFVLLCLASVANSADQRSDVYSKTVSGQFDLVTLDLQDAVVNKGLVIDYRGDVGAMLERTGSDVDANSPYANASYLHFCSAKTTHAAVAADSANIALCPYTVFAYELKQTPGQITVGYRRPYQPADDTSKNPLEAIDQLLKSIVDIVSE